MKIEKYDMIELFRTSVFILSFDSLVKSYMFCKDIVVVFFSFFSEPLSIRIK